MTDVNQNIHDDFAPAVRIALAYSRSADRPAFQALFAFDNRLADIVANSSEAMIGQIRLAWWRDILAKPLDERPHGEPLLELLQVSWGEKSKALTALIDGWEALLVADSLNPQTVKAFTNGRQSSWQMLAEQLGEGGDPTLIGDNAEFWALADLASHLSNADERDAVIKAGRSNLGATPPLPRKLRPFAILGALGARALSRGGRPLMEGRGAALCALRIGIFGR